MKTTLKKTNHVVYLKVVWKNNVLKKKIKSYNFYNGKIVLQKKGGLASEASRGLAPLVFIDLIVVVVVRIYKSFIRVIYKIKKALFVSKFFI